MSTHVPSAPPISAGVWPVLTQHHKRLVVVNAGAPEEEWDAHSPGTQLRAFGAPRKTGRYHIGVDLYARDGDLVCAITDGVVVRNRGIFLQGTRADGTHYKVRRIIVDHGGILVGYGEVWPLESTRMSDYAKTVPIEGVRIYAGQAFARVTKMRASSMLHLETWSKPPKPGRAGRWYRGESPPEGLLDPTAMLLALAEDAR